MRRPAASFALLGGSLFEVRQVRRLGYGRAYVESGQGTIIFENIGATASTDS